MRITTFPPYLSPDFLLLSWGFVGELEAGLWNYVYVPHEEVLAKWPGAIVFIKA